MGLEGIEENPEDALDKIQSAMNEKNYIFALFLEYSTLESYLDLLILNTPLLRNDAAKDAKANLERINFPTQISLLNLLGIIDNNIYGQVKGFQKERNKFVHDLIGNDFSDSKTNNEIKRSASKGLGLCKEISKIYEKMLSDVNQDIEDQFRDYKEDNSEEFPL